MQAIMGIPVEGSQLVQVDFEVFGQVQGCGFPKIARDLSVQRDIRGWIKNTKRGTIAGKMQGRKEDVDQLVVWLSKQGSPGCKIDRCELTNWGTLNRYDYKDYAIRF